MQEDILSTPPSFKLYTDRAVLIGTFIGGPLVAGYLAAENYRQLGQQDKAGRAWIISILATVIIFGGIFILPADKIPPYIIPITYTLIARYLVKTYQGPAIITHVEQGGPTYTVGRAVWIGLVGLVILFLLLFGFILLTNKDVLQ
ncbi:MAG TPA: hypothetical protein VFE32_18420 [Puia sp.]|jgi:hypothetical protein|nr:hypothetical protein [Puia sp.]